MVCRQLYETTLNAWHRNQEVYWYLAKEVNDMEAELKDGVILELVERSKEHHLHGSPWESVHVKWEEDMGESFVNPWELLTGPQLE